AADAVPGRGVGGFHVVQVDAVEGAGAGVVGGERIVSAEISAASKSVAAQFLVGGGRQVQRTADFQPVALSRRVAGELAAKAREGVEAHAVAVAGRADGQRAGRV